MFKFEYRIVPVPSKKDVYNLSITRKGWLQLAGISTACSILPWAAMWVAGAILDRQDEKELQLLIENSKHETD